MAHPTHRHAPLSRVQQSIGPCLNRREALRWGCGLAAALATGCGKTATPRPGDGPREVVVYSSLDREFSRPLLLIYEKRSGVRVMPVFDVESTKSFGLTRRIELEAAAPACDLFWNNEILNTVRLKKKGLLQPFRPAGGDAIPSEFVDPDHCWYGFAARARVLLVNTNLVPDPASAPRRLQELMQPAWREKVAMAKPLFGTTGTHAASLFATWGEPEAKAFFDGLHDNGIQVLSGNRQSAAAAASGAVAVALTDTDDALAEVDAGSPVRIVYLDRQAGETGTLFIPNTLALIQGAPNREEAQALAGYLLSPRVEQALAEGPGGQIPLNPSVEVQPRVETPRTVHPMKVDFDRAAELWEPVVAPFLANLFGAGE